MDNKNFAIVHFHVDNSVEVVPRKWTIETDLGQSSYYPPTTKGLKKSVKRAEDPDVEWPIYDVTIKKWFGNVYFCTFLFLCCICIVYLNTSLLIELLCTT